jgi:hypothetical protein
MRYTVTWINSAEDELTRLWMAAADPEAVRLAADQIDQVLRDYSWARGNDRAGTYQLTILPLRAFYEVSPDDCLVTVLDIVSLG